MSDPKDTKKDELNEEQLASASGAGPHPSATYPPKPERPSSTSSGSELTDDQLTKASGGGGTPPVETEDAAPPPPSGPDIDVVKPRKIP